MLKEYDYYVALDLDAVAKTLPIDRDSRLRSESLSDIIYAIYWLAKTQPCESSRLIQLLGAPDSRVLSASHEVWAYDWIGKLDGREFQSRTSFRIVNGRAVGLEKETQNGA